MRNLLRWLGHASASGQVWTNSTAAQILITGLIARVADNSKDPLSFLTDFRDEIKAVVGQVRISGISDPQRVRETAQKTVDELFSLMKPPSTD